MTDQLISNHPRQRVINIDAAVAWIVMFFMLLFAIWTLAHHAATFFGIPWQVLSFGSAVIGLPAAFLAARGAQQFSLVYAREVENVPFPTGLQEASSALLFVTITALLLITPTYSLRFFIALFGFSLMWWLTRQKSPQIHLDTGLPLVSPALGARGAPWVLAMFAFVAVIVTLASHRPDLDDSNFIQIAAQTLRFPGRAQLTFDASLGGISEPFRFAPYRVASYETLIALFVEWTGFDLLNVYYLLLPALTAALTICAAYLLTRWFLPSEPAVLATGIFLIIMLAWGESHVAYGNRVFVRLFQGKGLLIALTTPMLIVAGLLLLRRPSLIKWSFLALTQIATIGVSSSGLVCTFVTTALVSITALRRDIRTSTFQLMILATTLIYPSILCAWLKSISGGAIPLSEIGTHLPINSSLGLGIREALALTALTLGVGALGASAQKREYTLLAGAVLIFVFNPWLSELLSGLSSRNMSWRLAWAAPVPLLLAIAFTAAISSYPLLAGRTRALSLGAFGGVLLLVFFLGAGRWTLAEANHVTWRWPSPKLPPEYALAEEISAELKRLVPRGAVLSNREIGAWLPLLAPEIRLVMPGHTYPIMLQTVLPATEFDGRMQLFNWINGMAMDATRAVELMKQFEVTALCVRQGSDAESYIFETLLPRTDILVKEIKPIAGHRLFSVTVGSSSK